MPSYWNSTATPSYQQLRPIIDWTNGRAGAEAYPMAPNSKVLLMDTQESAMYVKVTDAVGRASLMVYDLVERQPVKAEPPALVEIDYDRIRAMIVEELKAFTAPPEKKSKKEA